MPKYEEVLSALKKIPPEQKTLVTPLSLATYLLSVDEPLKGALPAQVDAILAALNMGGAGNEQK